MKIKIYFLLLIFLYTNTTFSQVSILMSKKNDVYTIPCKVNGLDLEFIFDTGASNVTISLTEALFMIKNGQLEKEDIIGSSYAQLANGDITENTEVLIREIEISGLKLYNVRASIVHKLEAPLLLGQSAISKLGTYQIKGNKLIILSNKYNEYEFLGIDLSKDIEDFGLSRVNLNDENPLLPIDFNYLKISYNHFLKEFQFDKQKVVFNNEGNIAMIILQKLTKGNNYEKENKSKEIFESLVKKINENYWVTEIIKARNASWKSKNFEILISIDNDKAINLIYIPKLLKNLNSNLLNIENNELKTQDSSDSKKIKELRSNIEKIVNETLSNQSSEYNRKFARIYNNNFEFHSEIKIAYKGSQKETDKINNMSAFYYLQQFIPSNKIKELFIECDFDYLIFKTQITDKDYKKSMSEKKISKKNLLNLIIPFSESELIEILE